MLRKSLLVVTKTFTKAYDDWAESGQLDAEGASFVNFIPRTPLLTEIADEAKYVCVLFNATKCGTPSEDTAVLNFVSKLAPFGTAYDTVRIERSKKTPGEDRKGRSSGYSTTRKHLRHGGTRL